MRTVKARSPKGRPSGLPAYVDQALTRRGDSWPHVLAASLSGGRPFQPLELPRPRPEARPLEIPTPVVVAGAVLVYGIAVLLW